MIRFILIHAPAGFIGGHCHVRVLVRHTRLNGDIICIQSSLEPGGLVGGFIRRLVTEVGPAIWLKMDLYITAQKPRDFVQKRRKIHFPIYLHVSMRLLCPSALGRPLHIDY